MKRTGSVSSEDPPYPHAHSPLQTKQNRFINWNLIKYYIILLILNTNSRNYCIQYDAGYFNRFYKTYFNVFLLAQFIVLLFRCRRVNINFCQLNIHYNNSFKIDAVITRHHDILLRLKMCVLCTEFNHKCLFLEFFISNLIQIYLRLPEIFNERLKPAYE